MKLTQSLLLVLSLVGVLAVASPVVAGHNHWGHRHGGHHAGHHHHRGHHHHWGGYRNWGGVNLNVSLGYRPAIYRPNYGGYGGFGYGGYGFRNFNYNSFGYGGYGFRNYGYASFGYGGLGYGGFNSYYARPIAYRSFGYPGYYAPIYNYPIYNSYPAYYSPTYYRAGCYDFSRSTTLDLGRVVVASRSVDASARSIAARPATRSTVDTRSRSRQLIKLGDNAFRDGRYLDALSRYRTAAATSPDQAEPKFRAAHAYLAKAQYELAASTFRQALLIDPTGYRDAFQLTNLYGAESAARSVHIENLAAVALGDESSSDAYFLLGLMLHYSGEDARAAKFFAKASALSPDVRRALAGLVPPERSKVPVSLTVADEI